MGTSPSDLLVERHRLAAELQRLRRAAGLSTYQLAERLGWSQSKVSKIENGRTAPSADDVQAWAQAIGAHGERVAHLAQRAKTALTEAIPWRDAIPEGLAAKQREVAAIEQAATTISYYQPVAVPGPLQIAEYAKRVFIVGNPGVSTSEVADTVAARMDRQAILYDEGKRLSFIIGEAALRWRYGSAAVLLAQLDRLRSLVSLSSASIAVLPFTSETPWHGHGFTLYDDRSDGGDPFVHVETPASSLNVSDPEGVAEYRRMFEELSEAAVTGEALLALLDSIAADVRRASASP